MEDSETTTLDSMLMEEDMADTEKSSEDAVVEDGTDDAADESLGLVQEGELGDGVMDNEDVEMADGVAEDSENNNLAPEDSMDAPAALLEGEDESEEVSQEPLSTSEGLLGGQFISQTDSLIVQNEPPQQLMEEAEGEGDVADGELEGDGAIVAEADTTDEPSEALEKSETGEELGEEALLLQQEGAELLQEEQDAPETVDLGALPEGMTLVSEHMEDEAEADAEADADVDADADLTDDMIHGEGETADDQGETTDEAMELPPDDDDDDETENSAAAGITLLAGSELSEQALNDLEDKIAAVTDGTSVQLLPGQENLQGMQLMEGDDKPEDDTESAVPGKASQQEIQAQLNAALLKQEEMKIEEEDQPESGSFQEGQQNAEADALATLASAALDHQAPTNGVKTELDDQIKTESDSSEPQWMDVGICKGTHCQVRSFYVARPGQGWDQNWDGVTTSTLPDHRALAKLELESGKAYKFRVAAINSCGRGPWSEVAAFKTSLPGFPGAPSAIKIAKTADGAHLSWEPPPIASGVIEDYHVYLAVRTATTDSSKQVVSSGANQLAFVRIYQGAANQCSVGNDTLSKAHIDMTTKPAILFRISARNEKGIGPATQVRWLQEVGTPSNPARPAFAPRRPAADTKPHGNYKRKKSE